MTIQFADALQMKLEPLPCALGAYITGIDVRRLDDAAFTALHQAWLDHVFTTQFADDVVRWEMDGDGAWQRRGAEIFTDGDAQERFYQWVADRQRR